MTATILAAVALLSVSAVPPTCRDPAGATIPCALDLEYYGGRVLANPVVHVVRWGPALDPIVAASIGDFYGALLASPWMDTLSEYSTDRFITAGPHVRLPGTGDIVGHGVFGGALTIQPTTTTACTGGAAVLDDAEIQAELLAQLGAGRLPLPWPGTVYAIHLPPGCVVHRSAMAVPGPAGDSCVNFCAYHGAARRAGGGVPYLVVPDMGGACELTCPGVNAFNRSSVAASGALAGAITDPEAGLATGLDLPAAWLDATQGEIGDVCKGGSALIDAGYRVQPVFSALAWSAGSSSQPATPACVVAPTSVTAPNFWLETFPSVVQLAPGGKAVVRVRAFTDTAWGNADVQVESQPIGVQALFYGNTSLKVITSWAGALNSGGYNDYNLTITAGSAAASGPVVLRLSGYSYGTYPARSAAVLVVVGGPPDVAIASPSAAGPTNPVSGLVPIEVAAASTDGHQVSSIEVAIDGAVVSTGPPSVWDSTTVADGAHQVQATAVDVWGHAGVASVPVMVNNVVSPPTLGLQLCPAAQFAAQCQVEWVDPTGADPPPVAGPQVVAPAASASAGTILAEATLRIDGVVVVTGLPLPATTVWATAALPNGRHTLEISASQADGGQAILRGQVLVANPPAVSLIRPAPGEVVAGGVTISTQATPAPGEALASFEFHVDGLVIASGPDGAVGWDSTSVADGDHLLEVLVSDRNGHVGSNSRLVRVNNMVTPPQVSIATPGAGPFSGDVPVRIQATPSPGTGVATIELLVDGTVVDSRATDLGAGPLTFTWSSRAVADGSHRLGARVTDTDGGSATAEVTADTLNHPPSAGGCSSGGASVSWVFALWPLLTRRRAGLMRTRGRCGG